MVNGHENFLIVMADQLSALALGCYGHAIVKSPNVDALARDGVLFEAAYSSSPLCTPARYAFMTGQHVSACGGYDNAAYMPSTMPTFAHYLRLMGYRTCLSGKMHFVGPDQLHGFEDRVTTDIYPADFGWVPDWTRPDERIDLWYHNMSSVKQAGVAAITNQLAYDDEVGAQALRVIFDHARGAGERPLCLVASFIHPHDPYAARRRYWELYDESEIDLPGAPRPPESERGAHDRRLEKAIALDAVDLSEAEIRCARRAYYANVSYVDAWLGRLLGALEETGMAENTTVLFTSDHGDMLGEHGLWYKMSFREWSCRVPLVIRRPRAAGARRVTQAVSHVDVLPTLTAFAAEATDTPAPEAIDPLSGRSLAALCHGDSTGDPDRAVSEYLAEGTSAPMLMLRRGRFKYVHCPIDAEQLFDLAADPMERTNLAGEPAQAERLSAFRREAAAHWDPEVLRLAVIADQRRRRAVHAALRLGRYQSWDYAPPRDPGNEYTRSHVDLTDFDLVSRFPRPRPFEPRWR